LAAVEPFLVNLFSDRAIISLPQPMRWLVARLIARRRAPLARAIYEKLGGASPLTVNTLAQAAALERALGGKERVFVAMRYWRPFSDETVAAVKTWQPDEVVLLPLYPQFSTTTTGSSLAEWRRAAKSAGLAVPTRVLCCYPENAGFIRSLASELRRALDSWPAGERKRVLFSAHGLPRKVVAAGDPYQWQVERTVAALIRELAEPELDAIVCYQSRVGPLTWIGPATDAEIRRAGKEGVGLVIVPVAFVSEHSETLVELDIEYRHLADTTGVPRYVRIPTVGAAPLFIAGLADLVRRARSGPSPATGSRLCPMERQRCPCAAACA
jgi:ferrochelatase